LNEPNHAEQRYYELFGIKLHPIDYKQILNWNEQQEIGLFDMPEQEAKQVVMETLEELNVKPWVSEEEYFGQNEEHIYLLTARPFSIGTYPLDGFKRFDENFMQTRYGAVIYDLKLPLSVVRNYELAPYTDALELAGKDFEQKFGTGFLIYKVENVTIENGRKVAVSGIKQYNERIDKFALSSIDILEQIKEGKLIEKTESNTKIVEDIFVEEPVVNIPESELNKNTSEIDAVSDYEIMERYPRLTKKQVSEVYAKVEDALAKQEHTEEELYFLEQYEGIGSQTDLGIVDKGLFHQFYTPYIVAKKMYELGIKHLGRSENLTILEPSMGTARFFKFAPKGSNVIGFDPDKKNVEIAKILYPNATVYQQEFETAFLESPRFNKAIKKSWLPELDLVIGNPPYGDYMGYYKSYMPKIFSRFEFLFVYLGLKLLRKDGILIFIVSQNFMNNGAKYNGMKEKILEIGEFVDAVRMPNGIFSTTEVGTDIIIFKKK
jgi:hypothetical protein